MACGIGGRSADYLAPADGSAPGAVDQPDRGRLPGQEVGHAQLPAFEVGGRADGAGGAEPVRAEPLADHREGGAVAPISPALVWSACAH